MFSREEFKELLGNIPEDFEITVKEFWDYVKERLKAVTSRVRYVYIDFTLQLDSEIPFGREESAIVQDLLKCGAQVQPVSDPILIAEAKAWREMAKTSPSQVLLDFYKESLREMEKNVVEIIDQTLKDGEMGILFITSSIKISFSKDFKVIRMFPFDPQDYLNRKRVKLSTIN